MSRTQAIVLFVIVSVACPSVVRAQSSLAEAARKEAARRKEVKGIARVITNKDLPNVPPGTATAPDATATAQKPVPDSAAAASGAPVKDDGKGGERDEEYWRNRLKQAREELENNRIYVDAVQSKINALTTEIVNRDDPAQRGVLETDRQKFVAELDRLNAAIVKGSQTIADIEEEARRAGAPAGWLR